MIFVDTGAWAAFFLPGDRDHTAAADWLESNEDMLVTSEYVVNELLTLLKRRHGLQAAIQAGEAMWSETMSTLVYLEAADIAEAWRIFQRYADKAWSFTDCASYAVMRRLGISVAFAFDRHFSQMPGIRRVP
jgi:uncharacterized protein